MNDFTLDWLLPLDDDEQFVGGKKKIEINENNPVGGIGVNYETDILGEEDD